MDAEMVAGVCTMKILLVSTPWEKNPQVMEACDDDSHYPLGVAYLHSYLESKGHEVCFEWLNNHRDSWMLRLVTQIAKFEPDIIGLNMLSLNRVTTYEAIEYLHRYYPKIRIVLGGIHATLLYHQILEKYSYVTVVVGEGEETFAELAEGKRNHEIRGIAYTVLGRTFRNEDRDLSNVDALPFPKHDQFFRGNRWLAAMITTRGCPNTCSFYCLNTITRRKVRFRSVQSVVDEMEYLYKSFPKLTTIWIHDESFFLNNQRVIGICDEIIKRGIKLRFICSGRAKPISFEMLEKLERAGFVQVLIGLESGDADVLKATGKGITLQDVEDATRKFVHSKIELTFFLIVGLPGETDQTAKNTAEFVQKLQKIKYIFFQDIGILTAYPGTAVYESMKAAGNISDAYWMGPQTTPFYTAEHSAEKLVQMKNEILDTIATERILTWKGFWKQWFMVPKIIPWYLRRKGVLK